MSASLQQKIGIGLLAFALFGAAWTSFRYFLAELHSFQGKRYERFWESKGAIGSTAQWQRARQHMRRALFYNSHNPDTLLRAARIYEWYAFTPEPSGELIRENLEQAAWMIDLALQSRPQDGFGMSARALLKARRWQIDESLAADLAASMALAPWERPVQRRVTYAGVVAWPALSNEGRATLRKAFVAATQQQPHMAQAMLNIAADYGRAENLCDSIAGLDLQHGEEFRERECPRVD